jgi:hypothetical protein
MEARDTWNSFGLKRLRLLRVKELAGASYLRINEIAALLKFEAVSHFVRDFKRTFGLTPQTYRNTVSQNPAESRQMLNQIAFDNEVMPQLPARTHAVRPPLPLDAATEKQYVRAH